MQAISIKKPLIKHMMSRLFWLMLALTLLTIGSLHFGAQSLQSQILSKDADALLQQLSWQQDNPGFDVEGLSRLRVNYQQPNSGHYYFLQAQSGTQLRSDSLADFALQLPQRSLNEVDVFTLSGPDSQHLLVHFAQYNIDGRWVDLAVAQDYSLIQQTLYYVYAAIALLYLLVYLLIGLIHYSGLKKHIGAIPTQQREMGLETLQKNLFAPAYPKEWLPMADRLHQALIQLRSQSWREQQISNAYEVVWPLDLHRSFEPYQLNYPDKHFNLDYRLPATHFLLHREDMNHALQTLLDNAVKWCNEQVLLTVTHEDNKLRLVFEDDGNGMDPERLDIIQQRTQARQISTEDGGLRHLEEIVYAYQGELRFATSEMLGGLKVTLSFDRPDFYQS